MVRSKWCEISSAVGPWLAWHSLPLDRAQRLDQLHVHALGQAADIVVRLDRHRRPAGERHALDHVGVERALREKLRAADLLRLLLEHVDEQLADGLALDLRIAHAFERIE